MLLLGPYTVDLVVLPSIWPSKILVGEMKDPSMFVHCCEWILRGLIWWYSVGIDIVGVVSRGMTTLGAIFLVLENLLW